MRFRPFVSIIVPVYNVEKFVKTCIESILNQSSDNFELIIVDDGSTDKSITVVKEALGDFSRVCIVAQENSGLSSARNTGILHANGVYVFFVDSDDYLHKNTIRELDDIVSNHQGIDILAFGAAPFLDVQSALGDRKVLHYAKYYSRPYLEERVYGGIEFYEAMSVKYNFVASACLYISKLSLIKENSLRFVDRIVHEDEVFTRQILHCANKVYFTHKKYYFRRLRENSITQSGFNKHRVYSTLTVAKQLYSLCNRYKSKTLRKDAISFYKDSFAMTWNYFRDDRRLANKLILSPLFLPSGIYKDVLRLRFPKWYQFWSCMKSSAFSLARKYVA